MLMMEAYAADFTLSGFEFKHEFLKFNPRSPRLIVPPPSDISDIWLGDLNTGPCPAFFAILQSTMIHWPEPVDFKVLPHFELKDELAELGFRAQCTHYWGVESLDKKVYAGFELRRPHTVNTHYTRSYIYEFVKRVLVPLYRVV